MGLRFLPQHSFILSHHFSKLFLFRCLSNTKKRIIPLEISSTPEQSDKKSWIFDEEKHTNMNSFLARGYTQSNYFTGTKFEYETLQVLKKYNFTLERVGNAYDEGVDFKGVSSFY